jgi:hypothetical protein
VKVVDSGLGVVRKLNTDQGWMRKTSRKSSGSSFDELEGILLFLQKFAKLLNAFSSEKLSRERE